MNTLIRAGLTAVLLFPSWAEAQVPSWYLPRNRVVPTVSFGVSLDPATNDFRYSYAVANGVAAEQRINDFRLEMVAVISASQAPPDWHAMHAPTPGMVGGLILWYALGAIDPAWVELHAGDMPSFLSEIAPGTALAGFQLLSPCAMKEPLRYYILGYNHLAATPDEEDVLPAPPWREDSVQGETLGPGDCTVVADWGSGAAATEGFVGLVNFASGAQVPAGALTVQFRFSRDGEVVHPASFTVKLNGTTVTSSFALNSLGDRVAVFPPGPLLKSGRNTLDVSITGVRPGTSQTATDSDRFVFFRP